MGKQYQLISVIEAADEETNFNQLTFAGNVTNKINEGWTPIGGISVVSYEKTKGKIIIQYTQAMIK